MSFSLESQLRSALSETWQYTMDRPGRTQIFTEFRVGAVIPDILAVHSQGAYKAIGDLKRLTIFESHVLASLLVDGPQQPQRLARSLYTRPAKAEFALSKLIGRGLVRAASGGRFAVRHGSFPLGVEITAVEAKLHRWKTAIDQAVSYLSFANRAYVALPRSSVEDGFLPILDSCRHNGLGLLSVDSSTVEVVITAPRYQARTPEWVWIVAKVFGPTGPDPSDTD